MKYRTYNPSVQFIEPQHKFRSYDAAYAFMQKRIKQITNTPGYQNAFGFIDICEYVDGEWVNYDKHHIYDGEEQ